MVSIIGPSISGVLVITKSARAVAATMVAARTSRIGCGASVQLSFLRTGLRNHNACWISEGRWGVTFARGRPCNSPPFSAWQEGTAGMAKTDERSSARHDDILKAVGNRLREARGKAGLTQKQLGDRAGVKQSYIFELERGRTNITLNTLVKMADVLGMDIRDLLPQTGPAPLSLVVLERLLEVCERIASILSDRQKQDAELLTAFRAFADLRSDFESALKLERPRGEG